MPYDVLRRIPPFRHLSAAEQRAVAAHLTPHEFAHGERIVMQGDESDRRVFLLESGRVSLHDTSQDPPGLLDVIAPGHYFGERAALLDEPRRVEARAVGAVRAFSMEGERFLELLETSPTFAHALGDILRDKQKLLLAFDDFVSELSHGTSHGRIDMERLLPYYLALEPALHPHANDAGTVDFGALLYAIRRLPDNITRTFALFLTDRLPAVWTAPSRAFRQVLTDVRPRTVYEMLPGKSMVLLRDGLSDLIDLVTCLCVLCIEARKIRTRVHDPDALLALAAHAEDATQVGSFTTEREAQSAPEVFARLPFTDAERAQLERIWPGESVSRLRDLAFHHEDYTLHISKSRDSYNSGHSEQWAAQIAQATQSLLGMEPSELPPNARVHIVSSNTHSVSNCLSPYMAERAEAIHAWGKTHGHKALAHAWTHPADAAYVVARDWFRALPAELEVRARSDRDAGILRMTETAFTGIQVELIDLGRIRGRVIDPGVIPPGGDDTLLVNIDFAFGQQAEEIIGTLLTLFGRNLASVSVLGKAGALQGARGDLLAPTAFIEQSRDLLVPLPNAPLDLARLTARVPGRAIHTGPMLTVAGTLLQNRVMLQFYRRIWKCIGLEMEGTYYHRRVMEAVQLGLVPPHVRQRYLYYVSDLPLDAHSNLASSLRADEGVPPLYAITREVLSEVFGAA